MESKRNVAVQENILNETENVTVSAVVRQSALGHEPSGFLHDKR